MKARTTISVLVVLLVYSSGCSSKMYFSRTGATEEEFRNSCVQVEAYIRALRTMQPAETPRSWNEDNPYAESGGILGNMHLAIGNIASASKNTKSFTGFEIVSFIQKMEGLGWTHHPERPKDIHVYSKKCELEVVKNTPVASVSYKEVQSLEYASEGVKWTSEPPGAKVSVHFHTRVSPGPVTRDTHILELTLPYISQTDAFSESAMHQGIKIDFDYTIEVTKEGYEPIIFDVLGKDISPEYHWILKSK